MNTLVREDLLTIDQLFNKLKQDGLVNFEDAWDAFEKDYLESLGSYEIDDKRPRYEEFYNYGIAIFNREIDEDQFEYFYKVI